MRRLEPTLPNLIRAAFAFLALMILFAACPLLGLLVLVVLFLIPVK